MTLSALWGLRMSRTVWYSYSRGLLLAVGISNYNLYRNWEYSAAGCAHYPGFDCKDCDLWRSQSQTEPTELDRMANNP